MDSVQLVLMVVTGDGAQTYHGLDLNQLRELSFTPDAVAVSRLVLTALFLERQCIPGGDSGRVWRLAETPVICGSSAKSAKTVI